MQRQIQLNIGLTTSVSQDSQTGNYVIYYNEFPQAIASGRTQEEAENNLIYLVEQMWTKQSEDLKKYLWDHYRESIKIKPTVNC